MTRPRPVTHGLHPKIDPYALKHLSRLTAVLVALLALSSFTLSFDALHSFAKTSGALSPSWAWLFPLVVDGSIIVFSVGALRSSLLQEDSLWSMSLVIVATVISVIFNIAHAPGGFLTCLVSATPPLCLFLSFETAMRQVRQTLRSNPIRVKGSTQALIENSPIPSEEPRKRSQIKAGRAEKNDDARSEATQLLSSGTAKRTVARQTGLSLGVVRRLAEKVNLNQPSPS